MPLGLGIITTAAVANSVMGVFVYTFNKKSATNRFFFFLCLAISAWIFATYFSLNSPSPESTLFWTRLVMVTATAQALFVYLLVITFPDKKLQLATWRYHILVLLGFLVAATAMSPYLFTGLTLQENGSYTPVPGPGFALFLPYALGLVGGGLYVLINKYRKSHGVKHRQIRLLLIGLALMFALIIIFNLILPLIIASTEAIGLSPLFTVIFAGFTTYAIITEHLFDIRVIIRRTVIFATLLSFVFAVYSTIVILFTQLFQSEQYSSLSFIGNLVAALVIGFS